MGGSRSRSTQNVVVEVKDVRKDEKDHQVMEERTLEVRKLKKRKIDALADKNLVDRLSNGSPLKQSNGSKEIVGSDAGLVQDGGLKPWATLLADNRLKEKYSELMFVSPNVSNNQKVVRFHSAEVFQEGKRWNNALLGCVYGLKP